MSKQKWETDFSHYDAWKLRSDRDEGDRYGDRDEQEWDAPTERDQAIRDAISAINLLFELSTTLAEQEDAHRYCTQAIISAEKAAKAGRW